MPNYFLQMIRHLRSHEEVMLWERAQTTLPEQEVEVVAYLADEYKREAVTYPYTPPPFDVAAALWGAQTLYTAAQLVLYRQAPSTELGLLLPPYLTRPGAAAMHAADLTLRFLPDVTQLLTTIDADDPLLPVLENHLATWHFSGILYPVMPSNTDLSPLEADACLRQRYIDRLIAHDRKPHPSQTLLIEGIRVALGAQNYSSVSA